MKKILLIIIIFFSFSITVLADKETVTFSACVDGDTAKLNYNNKEITVRFLAIDTPETVHPTKDIQSFGKEASDYTCSSLKNAKKIEIEFDPGSDNLDKYDRYLVWIFVDDVLLQKQLIKYGYGRVYYIYGDYLYTKELTDEQIIAQNAKIGIWSLSDYESSSIKKESSNDTNYLILVLLSIIIYLFKRFILKKK